MFLVLLISLAVTALATDTFQVKDVQGYLKLVNDRGYTQCWGSNVTYFVARPEQEYCYSQQYSALCTHDPFFYQVCGAVNATACENQYVFDKDYSLCGYHVCQYPSSVPGRNVYLSGRSIEWHYDCNGKINCFNPENLGIDEKICKKLEDPYICNWSKKRIAKEKRCDGIVDCLADSADDEYGCGHTYGMDCNYYDYPDHHRWQPPRYVCIPAESKSSFRCKDDIDVNKTLCEDQKIGWCRWRPSYARIDGDIKIANRTLTKNHMCTLLEPGLAGPCIDGRDQLNCSSGAALTCNVNHYGPSTITKLGLCTGFDTCDDGLDEICEVPEFGCKTHKHTFCDGVKDCPFGSDEGRLCDFLVSNKTSCVRKVNYGAKVLKKIPMDWLCDGFEDCENGIDEDKNHWTVCGSPSTRERCIEKGRPCQEMYRCDITESTQFIELKHLCDSVLSCENEQDVCAESRKFSKLFTKVIQLDGIKRILQCLPGLEDLQKISGTCNVSEVAQLVPAFGIDQLRVVTPSSLSSNTFCEHSFGELYVYLTCLGLCPGLSCILRPISPKSCLTGLSQKVFTLSKDKKSLILVKKDGNSKTKYSHQEMFPCNNGNCVPYEKVCNLANDCGDDSDELDCANHFRCGSGEFIPLKNLGDGKIDCRDQNTFAVREVQGYLKLVGNQDQIQCWGSNVTYTIFRPENEYCLNQQYSALCTDDPVFYQACGAINATVCENQCKDEIDLTKELCEDRVIGWCYWQANFASEHSIEKRNLTQNHMCTPLKPGITGPCIDGRDQLNCTAGSATSLTCTVDNYTTSITHLGLCTGFDICDDRMDEVCEIPEYGCNTHKHTFCDGVQDCPYGSDEGRVCYFMVSNDTTCVRRVNYGYVAPKQIPVDWLCDGLVDCENGIDEDKNNWNVCGSPQTRERCIEKGKPCQEMYRCDITSSTAFVELKHLCDGISLCENEDDVCKESRGIPKLSTAVIHVDGIKRILQCLPGLDNLQKISDKKDLILVKKDGNSKTKYSHQEMFPCNNGNCVPYEKVCNLANDCGDDSDELDCANHFRCGSGEFIPLSSQADGNVDCRDQSDECDSDRNSDFTSFS
ncbi:low-density lipoprotein receptor-related protein 2-like [Bolinopsis microptera]|uniref:low-density lipoprotein receptor-related protein 2-like n=1 Tax=Bolinopsis microptera TaxID=2820187 RepID=UPI003079ED2F